jgi:hypothetical protein
VRANALPLERGLVSDLDRVLQSSHAGKASSSTYVSPHVDAANEDRFRVTIPATSLSGDFGKSDADEAAETDEQDHIRVTLPHAAMAGEVASSFSVASALAKEPGQKTPPTSKKSVSFVLPQADDPGVDSDKQEPVRTEVECIPTGWGQPDSDMEDPRTEGEYIPTGWGESWSTNTSAPDSPTVKPTFKDQFESKKQSALDRLRNLGGRSNNVNGEKPLTWRERQALQKAEREAEDAKKKAMTTISPEASDDDAPDGKTFPCHWGAMNAVPAQSRRSAYGKFGEGNRTEDGLCLLRFGTNVSDGTGNCHGCFFDLINTGAEAIEVLEFRLGTRSTSDRLRLYTRRSMQRCRGAEKDQNQWREMGSQNTSAANKSVALKCVEPLRFARGTVRGIYIHGGAPVSLGEPSTADDGQLRAEYVAEAKGTRPFLGYSNNLDLLPAGGVVYRQVH